MKEEIEKLILKCRTKIADKQRLRDSYERAGKGGACISLTGEIQAYNEILSDLRQIIYPK
jgi:hypothetical protein